jgi:L-lysine 2,3-aminomutase
MGNPRTTNGHRRRQLRARILAAETDCAICQQAVDKSLHYLDPMAPEVDEIIPVSFGGDPLARANTRLVHR